MGFNIGDKITIRDKNFWSVRTIRRLTSYGFIDDGGQSWTHEGKRATYAVGGTHGGDDGVTAIPYSPEHDEVMRRQPKEYMVRGAITKLKSMNWDKVDSDLVLKIDELLPKEADWQTPGNPNGPLHPPHWG